MALRKIRMVFRKILLFKNYQLVQKTFFPGTEMSKKPKLLGKLFFNFFQFFAKILSQIGLKYFLRYKKIENY